MNRKWVYYVKQKQMNRLTSSKDQILQIVEYVFIFSTDETKPNAKLSYINPTICSQRYLQ